MKYTRRVRIIASSFVATSMSLCLTVLRAEDRLPPVPVEKMTDAQKKAAAEATAPRGGDLPGWLVALSRSPEVMTRTKSLGDYVVREKKTLSPQLTELAILIVARQWTQQYLWNSHRPAAIRAGVDAKIVDALAQGKKPEGISEDQQAMYNFSTELLNNHEVGDATWSRAVGRFGEEGVIDTEGLLGYYILLSMAMNTGHTPLPPGGQAQLQPLRP
jgi:4-carboxymuconolactone decarboxylase